MNGALTGIVLVLLWGIVAARLPTLWRDAQQRAMWSTLCTLALTKTVATPAVNGLIGDLVPNAQIIPHLLGVLTAFFLLRFLSLITGYDAAHACAARYQVLLAASVLATLIILMVATPGGIRTRGTELMSAPTGPTAVGYWVVLNGYLGTVLVIATALFWRISRSAPDRLLRNSLRAMAGGTLLVATYAVLKTGLVVAHGFDVTMSVDRIEPVANALRTVGTIICLVGAVVPAGGRLRSIIRAYLALWELRPLWNVMRRAFPDVILFPRRRALLELAGVDEVQLRLYRRVIEIRDGMLTLRDYLPAGALAEARAYVGDNPPLIEACGIALALRRLQSGAEPAANGGLMPAGNNTSPPRTGTPPVETDATPARDGTAPIENSAMLPNQRTPPAHTDTTPAQNGTTPTGNSTMPANQPPAPAPTPTNTTPAQNGTAPTGNSAMLADERTPPARSDATPAQNGTTPTGNSAMPADQRTPPARSDATPDQYVPASARHHATPTRNGTTQAETSARNGTTHDETPAPSARNGATEGSATPVGSDATTAQGGDRWADIGGEIADEVAWLSAVSSAYRRPETAAFAERQLAEATRGTELASAHSRSRA